jgi:hypothetical protein
MIGLPIGSLTEFPNRKVQIFSINTFTNIFKGFGGKNLVLLE